MWLWYDWQAAAVADEHGHLVDVMQWDGHMTEHAVVERLRLIASGQPIEKRGPPRTLPRGRALRARRPSTSRRPVAVPSAEQQALADSAALRLAVEGVQAAASDPDRRLEHLVRGSDECGQAT